MRGTVRPSRYPRSPVNPMAAMPTQTGQAMRDAASIRENAAVQASGNYTGAIIESSGIARDDEIQIANAQAGREAGIAWTANGIRVSGINTQERMSLRANQVMFEKGKEAIQIREDAAMQAACVRAAGAVANTAGHILSQQVGRLSENFSY